MVMNLQLTDDQALLRRSIREFAEAEIRPHVREWDEAQSYPPELMPRLAALGLMGIQFPEVYGGAAMNAVDYCICIEELKRQYLVPLARGEKLAAWGLTESSAGSDAAAIRTTAARDGDGWVIN